MLASLCLGYSMKIPLALGKICYQVIFLFLHKNIHYGYSLEAPHRGASNEYPQCMFSWKNKKNINTFLVEKEPYLELWSPVS